MRVALCMLAASLLPAADVIKLNEEHQTIENFGASDAWRCQKIGAWSIESREKVADLLFSTTSGIGLSCWRFNIGGGVNPRITMPERTVETFEVGEGQYDWSRQENERWFLQAAKQRGVPQFLAFAVSPPGRMTLNGLTFCDKGANSTNLKPGYERQYARYLADILEHLRDSDGIAFDYISPLNEPQWDWDGHTQEGTRNSNADIKALVQALGGELQRRSLATQIAILESGNIPDLYAANDKMTAAYGTKFGDYLDDFLGDGAFSKLLSGRLSYHSYWSDRIDGQLLEHRQRLAQAMKDFPGWKLWQSEYCILDGPEGAGGNGRDLTMKTALDVARVIHLDLTIANVSAWQWWTAVSEADYKDGLVYTDWKKPGDPESIIPSKLLWAFGNYSRFVRPGMKRITLQGDGHDIRGLMGSAYKDGTGRRVVAVYVNVGNTPRHVSLRFEAPRGTGPLQSVESYITSDAPGDDLRLMPAAGRMGEVDVPARSVVTVVAQFAVDRRKRM